MWKAGCIIILLCILSFYDIKYKAVPYILLIVGSLIAMFYAGYCVVIHDNSVWDYILAGFPGALFLLTAYITKKVGYGDGWLLMILGMTLDYGQCLAAFLISLLLISIFSIILIVLRKGTGQSKIPYIPFLTIGVIFSIVT